MAPAFTVADTPEKEIQVIYTEPAIQSTYSIISNNTGSVYETPDPPGSRTCMSRVDM